MRHEHKFFISMPSASVIKSILSAAMTPDPHYENGAYSVVSLYFDDLSFSAYTEKTDGAPDREKFRLRQYNGDLSYIKFEKKTKKNELVDKTSETTDEHTARALVSGDKIQGGKLLTEFEAKRRVGGLRPAVVVKYDRTAYIYPSEHVRVTVDENLRFSRNTEAFFEPDAPFFLLPGDNKAIIEVKFDNVFPSFLSRVISSVPVERTAFSKYAMAISAVEGSYL